jgi:serine/threonine protein kinase
MVSKRGKLIGKGSFGSVHEFGAHRVIKISHFKNEGSKQDTYEREVYFLKLLQDTGLVPLLKSYNQKGQIGVQIMERFDGCMKDLGSSQALQTKKLSTKSLLFTTEQFQVMCSLAKKLDLMGIHHGDFKLRNLLYQNEGHKIRVADFGFAGGKTTPYLPLIGFVRHYGCPATKLPKGDSFQLVTAIPESVLPFANRMHLYMYFVRSTDRCFLLGLDRKVFSLTKSALLTFLSLTLDQEKEIHNYCPQLLVKKKKEKK